MPASIHLRFLTGRAHLHPWHAAPNEGRVEWPPSPWRLLRALVAVAGRGLTTLPEADREGVVADDWFVSDTTRTRGRQQKQERVDDSYWRHHRDALPFGVLASLLHKLAGFPVVWLPRTGIGHTRHFFSTKVGTATGSAVFDTFAAIDTGQPLVFEWTVTPLDQHEERHLRALLARLLYFGRSESWCDVQLETAPFAAEATHWPCVAVEDGVAFREHFAAQGLREYRDYAVEKRLGWDPVQAPFLRERFKAQASDEPELLLRALIQSSGDSMKHGDRPWGTRWLQYAVPKEIFRLPVSQRRCPHRADPEKLRPQLDLQVVRYVLNTATVHRAVLPPVTATLTIAQHCRAAAMAVFGRQNDGRSSPQLSGKRFLDDDRRYELFTDSGDNRVTKFNGENGSHAAHAYWWPVDEDGDGFLDHLIVLCEDGFSAKDIAALRALNRVRQDGLRGDLLLTPASEGTWEDCPSSIVRHSEAIRDFVSATPYFCPIHLTRRSGKRRSLKDQVIRSLSTIGLPVAAHVDEIVFDYDPSSLQPHRFGDPRQRLVVHVQEDLQAASGQVLVERGGFVVATLNAPLPTRASDSDPTRYPRACIRDPDDPRPLGMSRGLFVSGGQRFVPALEFHRIRAKDHVAKGPALMLRMTFDLPHPARPFAIGQFCHFGLGLFVPAARVAESISRGPEVRGE